MAVADVFDAMPEDCTPVAVELTEDAVDLPSFVHPEHGRKAKSVTVEAGKTAAATVRFP